MNVLIKVLFSRFDIVFYYKTIYYYHHLQVLYFPEYYLVDIMEEQPFNPGKTSIGCQK